MLLKYHAFMTLDGFAFLTKLPRDYSCSQTNPTKLVFRSHYKAFAFDEAFPDAWMLTKGEVRVPKSFCLFEVCALVKNKFLPLSFALVHVCVCTQESFFCVCSYSHYF